MKRNFGSTRATRRALMLFIALSFSLTFPCVGRALIDCTTTPVTFVNSSGTVPDDLVSYGGSGPCVSISYGGTIDFAGRKVTCIGQCGTAIVVNGSPPLTSAVVIKNAIVEGSWTLGVDALSASQKRVLIQYNHFLNLHPAANVIFGGTSIEGNVIVGTPGDSGGTAIYWSPISTSILGASYQWVRNNYIHFVG